MWFSHGFIRLFSDANIHKKNIQNALQALRERRGKGVLLKPPFFSIQIVHIIFINIQIFSFIIISFNINLLFSYVQIEMGYISKE